MKSCKGEPSGAALPLLVQGVVQHGDKRGRLMGFPTANQNGPLPQQLPFGVYASETRIPGRPGCYRSISSYGTRPTFNGVAARLETHIIDFEGDLYGQDISVRLVGFVRPELRFQSSADLVAAMQQDLATVRAMPLGADCRAQTQQETP